MLDLKTTQPEPAFVTKLVSTLMEKQLGQMTERGRLIFHTHTKL
jgi:hypothetical protein